MSNLREAARGTTCIRCGAPHAYLCHYNGLRQHFYGKGRGIKGDDRAGAEFCYDCDQMFSEGSTVGFVDKIDRSEQFLHYCMMTNIRRDKDD